MKLLNMIVLLKQLLEPNKPVKSKEDIIKDFYNEEFNKMEKGSGSIGSRRFYKRNTVH
jgi:hypothetical protein